MNLPRVLATSSNYSSGVPKTVKRIIHPINVSLTLNITPLSYASIKIPKDEKLPQRGLVELFTPYGSAGVFRVRSPQDAYGDEITSAELEHSIAEVGDYLVKDKINEMVSADSAMERVFSHYNGKLWKLGDVSALGSGKIALSINYNRVLDSMLLILEQKTDCMMDFDFSTSPWTVKIVKKGTKVTAEGRLSRNVSSATISYDDSELCTRLYYETYSKNNKGETISTWTYKDADTKSKYGIVERDVSTSSDMTSAEISSVVDTYLEEHKNPKLSVSIEGIELSHITGESMDKLALGKLYRLVIPEYDVVLEDNIVGLSWSDLYGNPQNVLVNVGDTDDTVVSFLHNLDSTGSGGGGGGGGGKKKEEEKWKEYETHFNMTDYLIDLNATRVNKANEILEKAGLEINSKGVLIYSEEPKNGLASRFKVLSDQITASVANAKSELKASIDVQANRIGLVVEGTGSKAKIKRAAIVASINNGKSSVSISADAIDIDGLVNELTTYDLSVEYIGAHQLFVNGESQFSNGLTVSGGDLDCEDLYCDGINGHDVSWKSMDVIKTITLSDSKAFMYKSSGQEYTMLGKLVLGATPDKIYYLGR